MRLFLFMCFTYVTFAVFSLEGEFEHVYQIFVKDDAVYLFSYRKHSGKDLLYHKLAF